MSCDRYLPLLLLAADDRLDSLEAPERDDLRAHLAGCPRCRQAVSDQHEVAAALRQRGDAPIPTGFAERVVARLDTAGGWVDLLRWRIWTYRLAPVAAVLMLLAYVTVPDDAGSAAASARPELAEAWAFDTEHDTLPAFALLGQENVSGDVLLDVILSTDADERLAAGDTL